MSIYRRPKGQYGRNTGDWFFERAMGGGRTQAAAVGQISALGLFNNATDGSILHVIDLNAWTNDATANIILDIYQGFLAAASAAQFPLSPLTPMLAGVLSGALIAAELGNRIGRVSGNSAPYQWPHDWPLAQLQPGYSLVIIPSNTNAVISASFIWLVMPFL